MELPIQHCGKATFKLDTHTGETHLYCPEHFSWSPSGKLCDLCQADPQFWQKHYTIRSATLGGKCIPCAEAAAKREAELASLRATPSITNVKPRII